MNQNIIRSDITLKDLLDVYAKEIKLNFNCHGIARVQSFDSSNQTVQCTMNYTKSFVRRNSDGTFGTQTPKYQVLLDCPAIILSGGNYSLRFPIREGDDCLILFNDRDMDNWMHSGQVQAPATQRLHSFADAIALIGLRSFANSIENYDSTALELGTDAKKLRMDADSVKLQKSSNTYISITSADKIKIHNASQNLYTILDNILTQLQALTVTGVTTGSGVSGVPANAAAIALLATQLGQILE